MTFQREPRYWVRRSIGTRWAYLNNKGQETIAPRAFGEDWTNGSPATYTLHQANKARDRVNATVDRDSLYTITPATGGWND
ncbi:MAG: hypothetical protein JNL05_12965 [Flavobacteriales bacterium]|nr:hypothetical protein [Flavobacteriales bacterium]